MAEAKQVDFLINGVRDPLTDEPLAGGKVYTYEAGTSTPAALYIDRDTAEGNATNPVILDAYGRAEVYGNGVYKFVVTDADDVTVIEMDGLEYYAVASDTAIPTLTANLNFGGNKGINLAPGTESGDAVEYAQFDAEISALETSISTVSDTVDDLSYAFTDLTDTPATLAGNALRLARVNAGATAVELASVSTVLAGGSILSLSDTPAAFTGNAGKAPVVNAGESALEFAYPDAKTIQTIPVSATAPIEGQTLVATSGAWVPKTPVAVGIDRVELFTTEHFSVKEANVGADLFSYKFVAARIDYANKTHHVFIDPSMAGILVEGGGTRIYVVYEPTIPRALYIDIVFYLGSYWMFTPGDFKRIVGYK